MFECADHAALRIRVRLKSHTELGYWSTATVPHFRNNIQAREFVRILLAHCRNKPLEESHRFAGPVVRSVIQDELAAPVTKRFQVRDGLIELWRLLATRNLATKIGRRRTSENALIVSGMPRRLDDALPAAV